MAGRAGRDNVEGNAMRLLAIELLTGDLPAQRAFFADILGLPILAADPDRLTVAVGRSRLSFRAAPPGWRGVYHYAFDIPENQLPEAKGWLAARVALLADAGGADEFVSEDWNARMVYFRDAAGNIAECIARHDLPNATDRTFSAEDLLCVSEIGLVADDVRATVASLRAQLDAPLYDGAGSTTFAAIGDPEGLLIVARRGRVWFPDTGEPAEPLPLTVELSGTAGSRQALTGPPYRVQPEGD